MGDSDGELGEDQALEQVLLKTFSSKPQELNNPPPLALPILPQLHIIL